ncbi:MAG: AAA family ATPase [Methylococcaceae bacterium]|nr:AAA family ATPase [Methylococcaceae bacterium]MDP2391834.1 AAA family ATPase [Methylococcaceae bacterium]MDP3018927.1 AAA family ATPase [Methylococcaceae bacterium]MDP3391488.1 AAA family ATPase [Methylococcaceae bacterium]MDZ4155817.1 AAA family ATPase [Methylococcales bacterium]
MKLKKLEITNFRCFDSLSIDLDEQLTVLVAKNGQGKSSVLDALRIGLWPFVSGFDLAHTGYNDPANAISIDDVRMLRKHDSKIRHDQSSRLDEMVRQFPSEIALQGDFDDDLKGSKSLDIRQLFKTQPWKRFRNSEAKGSKTKDDNFSKLLKNMASIAQDQVRNSDGPDIDLPVIGYYGTGRLWSQKSSTKAKSAKSRRNPDFYMRLSAYRDCLDPASSYKDFAEWFIWLFESYREEQSIRAEKGLSPEMGSLWKNAIRVIQQAIDNVLQETGWHTLEYSVSQEKSLILNHDLYGTLKVESLSDGIRGVLAMVGDIAYRCIKLNWHYLHEDEVLNAAKKTRGVVMIDEVDMHLHPAWQQTILGNLIKAFPKIQFIVTTHSPQVISTVPSHQIRILADNQVISAEAGTQGAEASRILNEVFGVELRAQNLKIVQELNRYLELIDNDKWDTEEALTLRQALDEWSRGNEPELVKADIDIRMKEFQRQL